MSLEVTNRSSASYKILFHISFYRCCIFGIHQLNCAKVEQRKFLMQLTYKYRLTPTKAQRTTIAAHLELCRRQYNYRLGKRFRWWESTRTPINACPLTVSIVPVEEIYQNIPLTRTQTRDGRKKDDSDNPLTRKGDIFSNIEGGYLQWLTIQLADLKNTKKLFPDYQILDAQVL